MFAKVFNQIFDSSIADNPHLRHFFMDLLVLADSDGLVDMTPGAIAARTRLAKDDVLAWLGMLEQPDPESRTPALEGRRIARLDESRTWGWRIVNFEKYRQSATKEMLRMAEADRKAEYRRRHGKPNPPCTPLRPKEEEAEADPSMDKSGTVRDMSGTTGIGIDWSKVKDGGGETTPQSAPEAPPSETKPEAGVPMHVDEADGLTNKPTLGMAIRHFAKCSDFDEDEVKAAYRDFEASKSKDGSWWWGRRPVGDWRAAMESRMHDRRARDENRSKAKPVSKILEQMRKLKLDDV